MNNILKPVLFLCLITFSCILNLNGQEWTQLNDAPFEKYQAICGVYDGKAYLFEGIHDNPNSSENREIWQYDPIADTWTQLGNTPFAVYQSSIGVSVGDKFYLGFGAGYDYIRSWNVYDYNTQMWSDMPDAPIGFSFGTMHHSNGKLFVGFGENRNEWYSFDLATNTWEEKATCPTTDIHECFSFVLGDYIYVGGGHEANSWYRYSVLNDTWETINNDLGARHVGVSVQTSSKGYVIGGDKNTHSAPVDEDEYFMSYDPIADSWTFIKESPDGQRSFSMSFIIDDFIYYFGGVEPENNFSFPTTMWKIKYDEVSAISGLDANAVAMDIYPNPVENIINLNSLPNTFNSNEKYHYQVLDINGKSIHFGILKQNQINATILPPGQYVLMVQDTDSIYSAKFIKK